MMGNILFPSIEAGDVRVWAIGTSKGDATGKESQVLPCVGIRSHKQPFLSTARLRSMHSPHGPPVVQLRRGHDGWKMYVPLHLQDTLWCFAL